jgi:hypothetical protein
MGRSLVGFGQNLRSPCPVRLPGGAHDTADQDGEHERRRSDRTSVSSYKFPQSIAHRRWTGLHGLIRQVPLNVARKATGRFVTAVAVFFEGFHHDPIQLAAKLTAKLASIPAANCASGRFTRCA